MSGILDNKKRVLDVLLTAEGRRQLASGDMRIKYVSFSDAGTYYKADVVSGSADASVRLYLEASNLPQDQITFEANDDGRLQPFPNSNNITIKDGALFDYVFNYTTGSVITGSSQTSTFLTGSGFENAANDLLGSSIDNFNKLQLLGSKDTIFDDDSFAAGPKNVSFPLLYNKPIPDPTLIVANADSKESLFNDIRLSRVKNFKYLPPINKVKENDQLDLSDQTQTSKYQLGNYMPWGSTLELSYSQLADELKYFEELGYCKTITFDPTSKNNRLVGQFFEQNHADLKKLDVIDFGQHRTEDPINPLAHVFFVGKLSINDKNAHTFFHMFTLVFQ